MWFLVGGWVGFWGPQVQPADWVPWSMVHHGCRPQECPSWHPFLLPSCFFLLGRVCELEKQAVSFYAVWFFYLHVHFVLLEPEHPRLGSVINQRGGGPRAASGDGLAEVQGCPGRQVISLLQSCWHLAAHLPQAPPLTAVVVVTRVLNSSA